MIADANVKVAKIGPDKRLEVRSTRYALGPALLYLDMRYEGRPVKLVSGKDEIPSNIVKINGSPISTEILAKVTFTTGTYVETHNCSTVFVIVPGIFI